MPVSRNWQPQRPQADVTIIEPQHTLLAGSLGTEIGEIATRIHRRNNVRLHLGTVTGWKDTKAAMQLLLSNGQTMHSDAIVVGVGAVPYTEWLATSGFDTAEGVLCSPTCHVAGPSGPVDGIVAAGDLARWPNLRLDQVPRRVEHWINAIEMGQHAANALLAESHGIDPFMPMPRFWSHQHGVRIQSIGTPALGTQVHILDGNTDKARFVAGYTQPHHHTGQNILIGAVAFNAPRTLLHYRDLIGHPLTSHITYSAA